MVIRASLLLVLIVASLTLAGCSDPAAKNAQAEGALSAEERIKKIENTPGMPEEQKAQAIADIRSHMGGPKPPQ